MQNTLNTFVKMYSVLKNIIPYISARYILISMWKFMKNTIKYLWTITFAKKYINKKNLCKTSGNTIKKTQFFSKI